MGPSGGRGDEGGVSGLLGAGANSKFERGINPVKSDDDDAMLLEDPASSGGLPAMNGKLLSKTTRGGLSLRSGGVGGVSDPGTVMDILRMASVGEVWLSGGVILADDELAWLGLLEVSLLPAALISLGVELPLPSATLSEDSLSLGVASPGVLGQTGLSQSSNTIYRM